MDKIVVRIMSKDRVMALGGEVRFGKAICQPRDGCGMMHRDKRLRCYVVVMRSVVDELEYLIIKPLLKVARREVHKSPDYATLSPGP